MGKLSWREPVPDYASRARAGREVAAEADHSVDSCECAATPGIAVESQHSEAARSGLAPFGELHRKQHRASVDDQSSESFDIPGTRSLFFERRQLHGVFDYGEHRSATIV